MEREMEGNMEGNTREDIRNIVLDGLRTGKSSEVIVSHLVSQFPHLTIDDIRRVIREMIPMTGRS